MIKMKKIVLLLILSYFFILTETSAQCAMCKRVAETDMEANHKQSSGKSLNHGILYLLSVPYLIGAVGAFAWYRNRRKDN